MLFFFFSIYLDFSFFFFVLFFCFVLFSLKRKFQVRREKGALVCLGEERGDEEKRAGECGEEEEGREDGGGSEYLSLFSRSRSFPLPRRHASLSVARALCVELLLLVGFLVGDGGLLGLLQRVAPLVLLLHPVHQQHHEEGGEQGAHHSSDDHRCGQTGGKEGGA